MKNLVDTRTRAYNITLIMAVNLMNQESKQH